MSQSQAAKLTALLARVQQRRNEPRLVAVPGVAAPSANTNLGSPVALARAPSTSIEDAIAPETPSSIPPAHAPSSIPPPRAKTAELPQVTVARTPAKAPSSTVPPASEQLGRAPTEVLPAADAGLPTRIAPSPVPAFDSAVKVTSAPRIDAAKSFGELLELSLALRPKAG